MIRAFPLRALCIASCVAVCSACYRWVPVESAPATALETGAARSGPIRLSVDGGQQVEFRKPVIRADSVIQRGEYPRLSALAVSRDAITKVEVHRFNVGKTVIALGLAALAYPILYAAYYGTCGCYDQ